MVNSSRQVGIERDLPSCGEPQAEQLRTPNRQIAFERNAPPEDPKRGRIESMYRRRTPLQS
jgi:hypothetical protein